MSAVVLLIAFAFQASSPALDVAQARQAIEAGKLDEARSALAALPDDNVEVAHLRGLLYLKLRDYPKASEAFRSVIAKTAPDSSFSNEALVLLGQSYFMVARMAETVAVLDKVVAAGVRTNEVFYTLANAGHCADPESQSGKSGPGDGRFVRRSSGFRLCTCADGTDDDPA